MTSRLLGNGAFLLPGTLTVALVLGGLAPTPAHAFEPYAARVPCTATATNTAGIERVCITCHDNADGGSACPAPPCLNVFGVAFRGNGLIWDDTLADGDADVDEYTNGQELGDPDGTWRIGQARPALCECATRPGAPTFTPGDSDADGDGYCCIGFDENSDGMCRGDLEEDPADFDCDEGDFTSNSGATELCTNNIDNDCDGFATFFDEDCRTEVDRDGDTFCPTGIDVNGDGLCSRASDERPDVPEDCDDDQATVFPGANENCLDTRDNDCDGDTDRDDSDCTGDEDADGDGFCALGRDLNDNGNCLDDGEAEAGIDCDDDNALVNTLQVEAGMTCTDGLDNDCDGLADALDPGCSDFFDADQDGFCPAGRDANMDRFCVTEAELSEQGDCDDADATRNPGIAEISLLCLNDQDDDCDGDSNLEDADCDGFRDTDGDRYCLEGFDRDEDGLCISEGEFEGVALDCDDTRIALNPEASELCTDGLDNDCDGLVDAFDQSCPTYRDVDGDGFCIEGEDLNDDGDCADAAESNPDRREITFRGGTTDTWTTIYPGAPENCLDLIDNDLDGEVDEAGACNGDADADGDGWCPLGRDLDGDGDCSDDNELAVAGGDCDDTDENIFFGAEEQCLSGRDFDCDGDTGPQPFEVPAGQTPPFDEDCVFLRDRDGDGFCGSGIDDNRDGDCVDDGEQRFGEDCDDENPDINVNGREICDDGLDNDCNGDIDVRDRNCECPADSACDDGDPCTIDRCGDSGGCVNEPDPACGDAGPRPIDGGPGPPPPPPGGCAVAPQGGTGGLLLGLFALGLLAWRRR